MTHDFKKALEELEQWFYSINWREGDPEPFKYKDSEEVLYKHGEAIKSALLLADKMRWRDISECPKDGTHIILLIDGEAIEGWYKKEKWHTDEKSSWNVISMSSHGCGCCGDENDLPTHFMPLPDTPRGG